MAGLAGGRITAGAGANLLGVHAADRNQDATCYVGSIDVQASEELIWELFVQAGPVGMYLMLFLFLSSLSHRPPSTPPQPNQSLYTYQKIELQINIRATDLSNSDPKKTPITPSKSSTW